MTPDRREEIRKRAIEFSERYFTRKGDPYESLSEVFDLALLDVWDEAIEEGAKEIDKYIIQDGRTYLSMKPIADDIRSLKAKGEK